MLHTQEITLRPDAKGRITLGKLAEGISSFHVTQDADGRLILEPYTEIPAREAWLFTNTASLNAVKQGLKESAEGKATYLGSFADDNDE